MMRPRLATPLAIATTIVLVCAFPAAQRSDTEGIKETENFIKAGDRTTRSIGDAKAQIQSTLGAYNTLVTQPSKDMKGDYKKLLKAVKEMNEKTADARDTVAKMENIGSMYFTGREMSIKQIQDAALRDQAQQRLSQNQTSYVGVLDSFQKTGQALEPLRKDLTDQISYLGSDLTPSGTASLKPQAEKLNQRGGEVFGKIDRALDAANAYFNAMRPTKS